MKSGLILLVAVLFCGTVWAGAASVRVSAFAPSRDDAAPALQKAIDSGAKHVLIDDVGFEYRIGKTIRLRGNLDLEIAPGVTLAARKGAFRGVSDFFFAAVGCDNLTIRGGGIGKSVLRMDKKAYLNPAQYDPSEWRHLISLIGCNDAIIRDLSLVGSGGDGIYLGANSAQRPFCRNILIENVECRDNNRQGISVISVEKLMIRNCILGATSGAAPMAGIDFEPNPKPAGQRLVDCVMERCRIEGNAGNGIEFFTVYLDGAHPPLSVMIRDCVISGNGRSGTMITTAYPRNWKGAKESPASGFIRFENCRFLNNSIAGMMLNDNQIGSLRISFDNCLIEQCAEAKDSPVVFASTKMTGNVHGGYAFNKIVIRDGKASRPAAVCKNWTATPFGTYDGTLPGITVETLRNQARPLEFAVAQGALPPRFPESAKAVEVKTKGKFEWHGSAARETEVRGEFRLASWSFHHIRSCVVTAYDMQNRVLADLTLNAKKRSGSLSFRLPETGRYIIRANSGLDVLGGKVPGGCLYAGTPLLLSGNGAELFFAVEPGTEVVRLRIAGFLTEPVDAELIDATGKKVAERQNIDKPILLEARRGNPSGGELWSIRLPRVTSAAQITLGKGIRPLFAPVPEALPR